MDTTLKKIQLNCPDGKYIKGLKDFGFLYQMDKRINAPSDAFSFCYKAENPLATDEFILKMEQEKNDDFFNSRASRLDEIQENVP